MKLKSYIAVSLCAFALAGCSDDDKKIGHEKIPPEIRHLIEWENEENNRLCGR